MSGKLRGALALLLAAAGVLALLLALDVRRVHANLVSSDVAFASRPAERSLWRPREVLPFGVARRLLGAGDDVEYRRAVRLYLLSNASSNSYLDPTLDAARGSAQVALTDIAVADPEVSRRSSAENLLGVIAFASAIRDQSTRGTFLENAVAAFQTAIKDEPGNDRAKYNLELALAWLQATDLNGSTTSGGRRRGQFGGGSGTGNAGSGY